MPTPFSPVNADARRVLLRKFIPASTCITALVIGGCSGPDALTRPSYLSPLLPAPGISKAETIVETEFVEATISGSKIAAFVEGAEVKTNNALFKSARFADLPGWTRDDLLTAWDAFLPSCNALKHRDTWKSVCANANRVTRKTEEVRNFFEIEFAVFKLGSITSNAEGEFTGYYEPLIAGSLLPGEEYQVPVYGVPNDLYTMDWKSIPVAQRHTTINVSRRGRELVVSPTAQPECFLLDTTQFDIDSRDRRWRIRLEHGRALPYFARGDIEKLGHLDAPVVAWVNDRAALYGMQVQGSGRILLRDGSILRLQYAEQNGHPFKPVRLVTVVPQRATRSLTSLTDDEPEQLELAQDSEYILPMEGMPTTSVVTRAVKPSHPDRAAPVASIRSNADAAHSLVKNLLRATPQTQIQNMHEADDHTFPLPRNGFVRERLRSSSAARVAALNLDPSYIFFKVAPNQSPTSGPVGALGVPLTAQRSIAVDPRTTPMGYPVYMSAPTPSGSSIHLQRLVMAQDTGGAIRGVVRADLFWGFGAAAGHEAQRIREHGQMWIMLPRSEAQRFYEKGPATRGILPETKALSVDAQCLISDETFCSELN